MSSGFLKLSLDVVDVIAFFCCLLTNISMPVRDQLGSNSDERSGESGHEFGPDRIDLF